MADKFRSDLTEGNVNKLLLKFAMPFLFAQILQALYSMTDMFIVGRFMGDCGIAAVNSSSVMTMFLTSLVSGFALSGTVLVAQYIGAKEEDNARKTIGTIFTLFIYLSIAISFAGFFSADSILRILNTPLEAFDEASNYLKICFAGTIFISGYNVVSAVLRGLGDSKRPLYFVVVSTVVNVILDVLFVGVFKMGAGGAGLATVIAQGISFILSVVTLYRQNFLFDFKFRSLKIDKTKLPIIFKVGLPSALQSTIVNFSYLFIVSNVNSYGLAAATASGIGSKIDFIAILPTIAISQAVASMSGQNIGAGKFDRAKETMFAGIKISMVFSFSIFLIVRIFSEKIVGIFGCTQETVNIGIMYVKLETFAYLFNSVTFIINGLANGSGNSLVSMFNALLNLIITRIPLIILFEKVFKMGLYGIFLAMGISQFAGVVTSIVFYTSGKWKKSLIY